MQTFKKCIFYDSIKKTHQPTRDLIQRRHHRTLRTTLPRPTSHCSQRQPHAASTSSRNSHFLRTLISHSHYRNSLQPQARANLNRPLGVMAFHLHNLPRPHQPPAGIRCTFPPKLTAIFRFPTPEKPRYSVQPTQAVLICSPSKTNRTTTNAQL